MALRRGLDNAGKTTIVKKFNGEDIDTIEPTLGFNIKTMDYSGSAPLCARALRAHVRVLCVLAARGPPRAVVDGPGGATGTSSTFGTLEARRRCAGNPHALPSCPMCGERGRQRSLPLCLRVIRS